MHQSTQPRHRTVRTVARRADTGPTSILGAVGVIAVLMLTWGAIVATGLN